jgi:hypothetical protein
VSSATPSPRDTYFFLLPKSAAKEAATTAKIPAPAAACFALTGELAFAAATGREGEAFAVLEADAFDFAGAGLRLGAGFATFSAGLEAFAADLAGALTAEAARFGLAPAACSALATGFAAAGLAAVFALGLEAAAGSLPSVGVSAMYHLRPMTCALNLHGIARFRNDLPLRIAATRKEALDRSVPVTIGSAISAIVTPDGDGAVTQALCPAVKNGF